MGADYFYSLGSWTNCTKAKNIKSRPKKENDMKKIQVISFVFLSIALILAACGGGQTQAPTSAAQPTTAQVQPTVVQVEPTAVQVKSDTLNLYAWSEYVPQQLLDDFSTKYGIKVNYDTYSSNEEMLAKLQAGASGYDVIIPSDYTVAIMIKTDMLEPFDSTQLTNFSNLDPRFINRDYDPGNKYTIPYQWGTTGLIYDKTVVPSEPQKWADLWDPAYNGRLVVLDDEREVMGMALEVLGYDRNSTNESELNQAEQKLLELKPNILKFDSDAPETAIISGETWAGLVYNGNASLALADDPNVAYICPTEGCTIWFDNLAIPKGAPHKDAAMLFLNWVMDPQESILITKEFPYSNPNKAALELLKTDDLTLYESYMAFSGTNPDDAFLANTKPIVDVGAATALYDSLWTDFKSK
jgi:spermidine/putrescine-binding protein